LNYFRQNEDITMNWKKNVIQYYNEEMFKYLKEKNTIIKISKEAIFDVYSDMRNANQD